MIQVVWKDPNCIGEVEDLHGNVFEEVHHADSQAELQSRLQARVDEHRIRAIKSIKPYEFARWKAKAAAETAKAVAAH